MRRAQPDPKEWLHRIRGEYIESPGLRLKVGEAERLWGLEASTCHELLETLVAGRFLKRARGGAYVRDEHR